MLTLILKFRVALLVDTLHLPLQFVVTVIHRPRVRYVGLDLVQPLDQLLVLPHDLVATHQTQFVLLQLMSSYYVGQVPRTQKK